MHGDTDVAADFVDVEVPAAAVDVDVCVAIEVVFVMTDDG